jgi:uncharacterized delta-60 repeat protein
LTYKARWPILYIYLKIINQFLMEMAMKKLYMLLAAVLLMVITGCGGGGGGSTPTVSSAKAITAFNIVSPVAATGVITESTHTIAITVPFGTAITALVPKITYTGASINPATGVANDFTNSVVYTVTAADNSTQDYTVKVTVSPLSSSLDTTFGTSGMVTTPIGSGNAVAHALGIQSSDGKIVAAGSSNNSGNDDFTLVRYNTDGNLDTSGTPGTGFGTTGIVTTSIGSGDAVANALGIQSDGKIVAAGYSLLSGTENVFTLVRYKTDGTLDNTGFGAGGIVTTPIGSVGDYALALGIQSDGKIVVAGYSFNITTNKYDFALVRYNTNGNLDAGFGTGGKVTTPIGGSSDDYANALGIQSDGKIVVAGYSRIGTKYNITLVRYKTDGTLDNTGFGTNGIVTTSIGSIDDEAHALVIQSDGKIVVAGSSYDNTSSKYDFALVRYNTDGSLDTSGTLGIGFGTTGIVTTSIGSDGYWDYAYALGIQSDKKILAAGSSNSGSNYDFALVRYNTDGSLDTTFNATGTKPGTVTTPIGSSDDFALALGIQSNGRIVVAGYSYNGSNDNFSLVRYLP